MSTSTPISHRRYRRRIIGLGAVVLVVTFAIGAAIFIPVVQNDLEDRVEAELVESGIDGVTASFSGQDGTLTCAEILEEPNRAEELAEDVHGVRVIELDRTCANAAATEPAVTDPAVTDPAVTDPAVTEPAVTDPLTTPPATDATETTAVTTTTTEAPLVTGPDMDSIGTIVDSDPLFGQLAGLLEAAELTGDDALGGDGPFTLLAPTDAAFDVAFEELGADAFNALASDPGALRSLLLHHATDGVIRSTDFVAGQLTMLDGTAVVVDPDAADGITFTSVGGGASGVSDPATQLDIEASNGVVHAIDRLLIPDGLDLGSDAAEAPSVMATLVDGQVTLTGVVQSEEQRVALITAAQRQVDPANVLDQLTVDADTVVAQADVDRLATLLAAMPPNLVNGEASLVGSDLSLSGTYLDDEAQAALQQLGSEQNVTIDLTPRDIADPASAEALQTELNDFVRLNPVLFEPNSATLTTEANAVIEQIAGRAARLDGTSIIIVGHTDSDGNAATNQTLSERRAASVLEALVAQGLDGATLASEGRGSSEPITDEAGAEDKMASRRVEFVVRVS